MHSCFQQFEAMIGSSGEGRRLVMPNSYVEAPCIEKRKRELAIDESEAVVYEE